MTRSIWGIALAVSAAGAPVAAREPRFPLDIPAGDLGDALATLSTQTGASIGVDVRAAGIWSGAVRGRHTIADALATMLARTPFRAERVGPTIWRLVLRAKSERVAAAVPPLPDVVVTARKQAEALSRIATPVAVYVPPRQGGGGGSVDIHDVAGATEGLSVTALGPGRDRPFIRGVADSPFNGFSQTTVSIVVDDARVTYDAPEPGLRLVDVARVEVLKGPQGPLYGTGALGGVYRVVTNRPVPGSVEGTAEVELTRTADGGPGANASATANLPLFGEQAAIRLVGYGGVEGGWVRDAGRPGAVDDQSVAGGRAALRVLPASGWTVDLGAARQRIGARDSHYVDRDAEDLTRSPRFPEPSSSRFSLVDATVAGAVGSLRLTASTGHAWQDRSETYDVTPSAAILGYSAGRTYRDRRRHKVFDQEVRLSSGDGLQLSWTAGVSYLSATTRATGTLRDREGDALPFSFQLHRVVTELAVFADGSAELLPRLRAGLGARVFRATTDDERSEQLGTGAVARARIDVTPSGSLAYAFTDDRTVYLRFGTAFRAGGLDPSDTVTGRYESDEVRSLDGGARLLLDHGRLSLLGGGFRSSWRHVQSDYLLPNGLVGTRNAGDATILGAEGSARWHSGPWSLGAGATVQRARLDSAADGTDLPEDRRLPIVPDLAGRLEIGRSIRIGELATEWNLRGTYVGHSRLSFDEGLDRAMGGYALLHADASTRVGRLDLRVGVDNLLNARADSFAFGNPFRVRGEREYTPLRPRTVSVVLGRRF